MEIRHATAGDVPGIARVHVASWHQAYQHQLPPTVIAAHDYPSRLAQWQRLYYTDHALVAVDQQRVVGFVTGGPQRSHPELRTYPGELYGLYVDPSGQHVGIGYQLFQRERQDLARPFTLDCLATNQSALAFYRRQGGQVLQAGTYVTAAQTFATVVLGFTTV